MITEEEKTLQEKVIEIVRSFQGPRMVLTGLRTESDVVWQLHRDPEYTERAFVTVHMLKTRPVQERHMFVVDLENIDLKIQE